MARCLVAYSASFNGSFCETRLQMLSGGSTANVLGWSIGAALGDGIKAALGSEDPIEFVVVFIVSTIVTAIVLVRMFRN